jgi:hypothetical protein
MFPRRRSVWVGVQSLARCGGGGAVCCGGVAGLGGACATAAPEAAISALARMSFDLVRMQEKRERPRQRSAPHVHDLR